MPLKIKEVAQPDDKRRAVIANMSEGKIRTLAKGKGRDAILARSVLREMGDTEAMPQGDQEPTRGLEKGGMSTKKYAKGGMVKCGASNPPGQKSSQKLMYGGMVSGRKK